MDDLGSGNCCTVCRSDSSRLLLQKAQSDSKEETLRLRTCLECSTTFLENWDQWHSRDLYDYYRERIGLTRTELYDPITETRYVDLLKWLGRLVSGKRILDIGCGQGHFVDAALRLGYEVQGIETSKLAVEICRKLGLPVRQMEVFSDDLKQLSFDICTLFEVIEHVPEPVSLLRRVNELIVPGGYLYLTTPNFASLDRRLMRHQWNLICPEHLTYFSPSSIRNLLTQYTSFEVFQITTRNMSLGALKHYLMERFGSLGRGTADAPAQQAERICGDDNHLRGIFEASRFLRIAKFIVNKVLSATHLGSGMFVLCRKPNDALGSVERLS